MRDEIEAIKHDRMRRSSAGSTRRSSPGLRASLGDLRRALGRPSSETDAT